MGSSEPLLVLVFVMKANVTYAWLVLLSIITCLERVNGFWDRGNTPLQVAVRKKDVDLVKSLIANGNDVKATNRIGQTALMIAAGDGSSEMMEILLPNSDVKATNKYGTTALIYAAISGNEKSLELLLPKSDVKASNKDGDTALMYAARDGNEKSVEL